MIHQGWIKLHRELLDWEWYTEPNMVHFMIHCLIKANHKPQVWKGIPVKEGEFISGRKVLSAETGLSEQAIRTCISKLKKTGELTSKTTNKYTLFSLNSWKTYQSEDAVNQLSNQQSTSNQPTINQQSTTNKNEKNEKNEKKSPNPPKDLNEVLDYAYLKCSYYNFDAFEFYEKLDADNWYKSNGEPVLKWKLFLGNWAKKDFNKLTSRRQMGLQEWMNSKDQNSKVPREVTLALQKQMRANR